jgi:hypothetical protein
MLRHTCAPILGTFARIVAQAAELHVLAAVPAPASRRCRFVSTIICSASGTDARPTSARDSGILRDGIHQRSKSGRNSEPAAGPCFSEGVRCSTRRTPCSIRREFNPDRPEFRAFAQARSGILDPECLIARRQKCALPCILPAKQGGTCRAPKRVPLAAPRWGDSKCLLGPAVPQLECCVREGHRGA